MARDKALEEEAKRKGKEIMERDHPEASVIYAFPDNGSKLRATIKTYVSLDDPLNSEEEEEYAEKPVYRKCKNKAKPKRGNWKKNEEAKEGPPIQPNPGGQALETQPNPFGGDQYPSASAHDLNFANHGWW